MLFRTLIILFLIMSFLSIVAFNLAFLMKNAFIQSALVLLRNLRCPLFKTVTQTLSLDMHLYFFDCGFSLKLLLDFGFPNIKEIFLALLVASYETLLYDLLTLNLDLSLNLIILLVSLFN